MRDELTAILIFALMIGGFALNTCAVDNCKNTVCTCIIEFEDAVKDADYESIEKSSRKLLKVWEQKKLNISYSCPHSSIDDAENRIFSAVYYAENGELKKALYESCFARRTVEDLSKKEKFRLDNIF